MSQIITRLKARRIEARNDRELSRMLANAGSQTMRDELIIASQRQSGLTR